MKIFISAFACNPDQGSEPGVGWTAVTRIAKDHDVFVMTDINHKKDWDKAKQQGLVPNNLHVRFIGESKNYFKNRFLARIQSWLWYAAFTRLVLKAALAWHEEERFDLCHQVTIAAWRLPSPLWKLPIPFVWGPIGGAGYIPKPFRCMLSPSARAFETVRDIQTFLAKNSRSFRDCIRGTSVVLAANEETMDLLTPYREGRPIFWLPIVSISEEKAEQFRPIKGQPSKQGFLQLFAGGNIEGRKGVSLALKALAKVKAQHYDFHYIVAGGGPEISSLKALSHELGLDEHVTFHPGYSGDAYIKALQQTDVYFLPSFRESTPVTLIEAYLAGCYPVVADTSAQGEIVRLAGGKAIPIDSVNGLIDGLAEAVIWCSENRSALPSLNESAVKEVIQLFGSNSYEQTLEQAYRTAISHYKQYRLN